MCMPCSLEKTVTLALNELALPCFAYVASSDAMNRVSLTIYVLGLMQLLKTTLKHLAYFIHNLLLTCVINKKHNS